MFYLWHPLSFQCFLGINNAYCNASWHLWQTERIPNRSLQFSVKNYSRKHRARHMQCLQTISIPQRTAFCIIRYSRLGVVDYYHCLKVTLKKHSSWKLQCWKKERNCENKIRKTVYFKEHDFPHRYKKKSFITNWSKWWFCGLLWVLLIQVTFSKKDVNLVGRKFFLKTRLFQN